MSIIALLGQQRHLRELGLGIIASNTSKCHAPQWLITQVSTCPFLSLWTAPCSAPSDKNAFQFSTSFLHVTSRTLWTVYPLGDRQMDLKRAGDASHRSSSEKSDDCVRKQPPRCSETSKPLTGLMDFSLLMSAENEAKKKADRPLRNSIKASESLIKADPNREILPDLPIITAAKTTYSACHWLTEMAITIKTSIGKKHEKCNPFFSTRIITKMLRLVYLIRTPLSKTRDQWQPQVFRFQLNFILTDEHLQHPKSNPRKWAESNIFSSPPGISALYRMTRLSNVRRVECFSKILPYHHHFLIFRRTIRAEYTLKT